MFNIEKTTTKQQQKNSTMAMNITLISCLDCSVKTNLTFLLGRYFIFEHTFIQHLKDRHI